MQKKIFYKLLLAIFLAIIMGNELLITMFTNPATQIKFYYFSILSLSLFILLNLYIFLNYKKYPETILGKYFLIILVYLLFSIFKSNYKYVSYVAFIKILIFYLFFLISRFFIGNKKNIEIIISVLLTTAGIVCIYGLLQFYGFDFYNWGRIFELQESLNIKRIIASLGNPNFLGAFLISLIPLLIILTFRNFYGLIYLPISLPLLLLIPIKKYHLFQSANNVINVELSAGIFFALSILLLFLFKYIINKYKTNNYLPQIFGFIYIFIFLLTLAFTYNRSGYLAFIIQIFIILFFYRKQIFNKKAIICIMIFFTILSVFYFASKDFSKKTNLVYYRFINSADLSLPDVKIRFYLWQIALNTFKSNYYLGKGLGTFEIYFPFSITDNWKKIFPRPNMIVEHAHSEFLEFAVETGIIGLILLLLFTILVLHINFILIKKINNQFYKDLLLSILLAFLGIILHSLFSSKLRYSYTIAPYLIFLSLIDYFIVYIKKTSKKEKKVNFSNSSLFSNIFFITTCLIFLIIMNLLKPVNSNIFSSLGNSNLMLIKKYIPQIWDMYNWSEKNDKQNIINLYAKLIFSYQSNKFSEAEKLCKKILKLSPHFKDVNYIYGITLNKQNKLQKAAYLLKESLKTSKENEFFYLSKVKSILSENNIKKYEKVERILKNKYNDIQDKAYSEFLFAKIQEAKRRPNKSYQHYIKSIDLNNSNVLYFYYFADFLRKQKKYGSSIFILSLLNNIDIRHLIKPIMYSKILKSIEPHLSTLTEEQFFYFIELEFKLNYIEKCNIHLKQRIIKNTFYKQKLDIIKQIIDIKLNGKIKWENIKKQPLKNIKIYKYISENIINSNNIYNLSNFLLNPIKKYYEKNYFNLDYILYIIKLWQKHSIRNNNNKITYLLNKNNPKWFDRKFIFNNYGIVGHNFSDSNVILNVNDTYPLTLYFQIKKDLLYNLKLNFNIENDTSNYGIIYDTKTTQINLSKYNAEDVIIKKINLYFPKYILSGKYNLNIFLNFKNDIINDTYNQLVNHFLNNKKITLNTVNIKEDTSIFINKYINKLYEDSEYDSLLSYINTLPSNYHDTDYYFLDKKIIAIGGSKLNKKDKIKKLNKLKKYIEKNRALIEAPFSEEHVYIILNKIKKIKNFNSNNIKLNDGFNPLNYSVLTDLNDTLIKNNNLYKFINFKEFAKDPDINPYFYYFNNINITFKNQLFYFNETLKRQLYYFEKSMPQIDFANLDLLLMLKKKTLEKNISKNIFNFLNISYKYFSNNKKDILTFNYCYYYLIDMANKLNKKKLAEKFLKITPEYKQKEKLIFNLIYKVYNYADNNKFFINNMNKLKKHSNYYYNIISKYFKTYKLIKSKKINITSFKINNIKFNINNNSKEKILNFNVLNNKISKIDKKLYMMNLELTANRNILNQKTLEIGYLNYLNEFVVLKKLHFPKIILKNQTFKFNEKIFSINSNLCVNIPSYKEGRKILPILYLKY